MGERHIVSVRTLVEFACQHGSLRSAAIMRSRLKEGTEGHRRLQSHLEDGWEAETTLSIDHETDGILLRVRGRADMTYVDADYVHVGEIKTTRVNPLDIMKDDYPEHWAQAEIYAYILATRENAAEARAELIYLGLKGTEHRFHRDYTYSELKEKFEQYCAPYAQYLKAGELWQQIAAPTFEGLKFPFPTCREGQIDMADAVYNAMKDGSVIIEAPTGIGKTAAALYGAVRALGEGKITRIFYLTARTTGRRTAEMALERMRSTGLKIRSVTITAKEKACLMQKVDCGACRYGQGYYDRCREAIREAMAVEELTEQKIRDLAIAHELCPFELSLDLTMIAEAIICDYNYVFDPRIRLKRHFERKSSAGILVDEAHNLIDRSREMYSAELSGNRVRELQARLGDFFPEGSAMREAMTALIDSLTMEEAEYEARREYPKAVMEAAKNFFETAEHFHVSDEATTDLMFECGWFLRVARMFDDRTYRAMIKPEGKDDSIAVKLWCFAPETRLEKLYAHVGGVALFSATLAPIGYYARSLGVGDPSRQMVLESPFPKENLIVRMLPVSVRFKDRADTMEKVTRIIHCMTETHRGNYLACFPSHAYLTQAYKYYRMRYPDENVICQKPYMSDKDRTAFIEAFQPDPNQPLIAFIVLGGIFSEGVDLPGDLLSGTAIISTGIPLPNPESELLVTLSEDDAEEGMDAAYTFPGFRKVLQAAGRVIRTETDRGVVLLIDDRYVSPKYRELFPNHWRVTMSKGMRELRGSLEKFWNE